MKKYLLLFILMIIAFQLQAQEARSNPYGQKYRDNSFNAMKVVEVLDNCGFKSLSISDSKNFKASILQLSDRAYNQINIDTWWLCSFKHEENFQIYNMYYKKVTESYYNENCKALIALMLLDGTIVQPK